MKNRIKKSWNTVYQSKLSRDFARLVPLLAIVGFLVIPDNSRSVVFFSLGILVLFTGLSHLLRKVLFPYIDMQQAWRRANDTPLGASIVFASISLIIATTIIGGILLLK